MAQSYETGNSPVTADQPITDLLSAPLGPGWTIEGLADQLLAAIAAQPKAQDQVLDAEAAAAGQSRRLIRPLLACLATKSAAENGTPVNLYGGEFAFQRRGPEGPIWILGRLQDKPSSGRASLPRTALPPQKTHGKP